MNTPQQTSEGRPATSLLFTPRTADGRSGSEYRPLRGSAAATRSPSPTPEQGRQHREGSFFRESSVGAGSNHGGGGGRLQREGSVQVDTPTRGGARTAGDHRSRLSQQSHPQDYGTPARGASPGLSGARGRRRSTTPVGPPPQEAPPPPPTSSLFDTAAVGAAWATPTAAEPPAGAEADRQNGDAKPAEAPGAGNADRWVIVYGFRAGDVERVMAEFKKAGEVVQHGTFGAPPGCNWLYLQYGDKWAAQRAMYRDGEQLSRNIMVGVRPLDAAHLAAIREHLQADGPPKQNLAPTPAMQRRYLIDSTPPQPQQGGGGIPAPTQTMWAKVNEFVFGIS